MDQKIHTRIAFFLRTACRYAAMFICACIVLAYAYRYSLGTPSDGLFIESNIIDTRRSFCKAMSTLNYVQFTLFFFFPDCDQPDVLKVETDAFNRASSTIRESPLFYTNIHRVELYLQEFPLVSMNGHAFRFHVRLPWWFLAVLLGAYPILRYLAITCVWRHRKRNGLCLQCGYDLRGNLGSSTVCPECGTS